MRLSSSQVANQPRSSAMPFNVPVFLSRSARALLVCAAIAAAWSTMSARASAAAMSYTGQFSPASLPEGTSFALSGDAVTRFSAQLRPTACQTPDWREDSDAIFTLSLPRGTRVPLKDGRFTYAGTARSSYGAGPSDDPYGGKFTITGNVDPDHTLVNAKVTLSGAQDPAVSGCSGHYTFIAIPTVRARAHRAAKSAYQSQFVNFQAAGGVVRDLEVQANFSCGDSVDSAQIDAAAYGHPTLHTTASGRFSLSLYALDGYKEIVAVRITGHVGPTKASGTITVAEPAGGFRGVANDVCHGSTHWSASKPTPPVPPGPTAFFQWAAIRAPAGTTYRYYFAADQIRCTDHATKILVTIDHRTTTVSCSRDTAFASGPLAPSHTYSITSQAVETSHGQVIKRGAPITTPVAMPGPGDKWTPISGLGAPPS
jgi:hypothetical protein